MRGSSGPAVMVAARMALVTSNRLSSPGGWGWNLGRYPIGPARVDHELCVAFLLCALAVRRWPRRLEF